MISIRYLLLTALLFNVLHSQNITTADKSKTIAETLDKWYNPDSALWETTSWWNAANGITALCNYHRFSKDTTFDKRIYHTFAYANPNDFLNYYFDDQGWWALAWLDAYDVFNDIRFLKKSADIFSDMVKGWDKKCKGGIYWRKDFKYKNAISNELFIAVASRLHLSGIESVFNDRTAFEWAQSAASWFIKSGMINSDYLVNDGLDHCRNNNGITWTYNQGVIMGAFTYLFKATNDSLYLNTAVKIANAAIATLVDNRGILKEPNEPNCNADQVQFKGIFIRNLAILDEIKNDLNYKLFIKNNANSIWQKARDIESGQIGLMWSGPFDTGDAARQISALDVYNALLSQSTD
ncbi:MAG: glycoside hydrolase family 76 protein [Calditrichaeota bacterium]|nr:glycoside hydrolase family 76 protein [Calditrichota bacterium]